MEKKYFVNKSLINFLKKKQREGIRELLFIVIVYISYTILMINTIINVFSFFIGDGLILVLSIVFIYASIFKKGNYINRTVKEITVDESIVIKTFNYNFLFINKPELLIKIDFKDFILLKIDYPFKKSTDIIKGNCWTIDNLTGTPFIIPEVFDEDFNIWLNNVPKI